MFRRDAMYDKDSNIVTKTSTFNAPVKRTRDGSYKIQESGTVYACMTSDFFIEEADEWRKEAWSFIRERRDLNFCIITKRIERFEISLPDDWGGGYENVTICATCENQKQADERLPILLTLPIKHRRIIHEPMLEQIDIKKYLQSGKIEQVTCGGESGDNARPCNYDWILNTREQCLRTNTPFTSNRPARGSSRTAGCTLSNEKTRFHRHVKLGSIYREKPADRFDQQADFIDRLFHC